MSVALNILIVGSAAAAGCGTGWWLGRGGSPRKDSAPKQSESKRIAAYKKELEQAKADALTAKQRLESLRYDSVRNQHIVSQLQSLAQRIAEDVGLHNTRVAEINHELDSGPRDAHEVLAAIAKLIDANAEMQQQLESAEGKLQQQAEELVAQATEARTDPLTRLANRRAFDEEINQSVDQRREQNKTASLVMIDVDDFKTINDQYGHHAGDSVLCSIGKLLKEQVSNDALASRFGGEEFAIIFRGVDLESAKAAAERIRAAIGQAEFEWEGQVLRATISVGVAELMSEENAVNLIRRADEAMYTSKETGRDCTHWHDGTVLHRITPLPLASKAALSRPLPANRDTLTGLSTQQSFCQDLERRIAQWRRGGPDLSVIFVEIDHFSELTTKFGDAAGDTMLRATAQFLKAAMRDMDHVARFDARQFALLLPKASLQDAEGVAERLRCAIEKCKLPAQNGLITFTISIGLTEATQGDTAQALIKRLERFVHIASKQGGNQIVTASEPQEA